MEPAISSVQPASVRQVPTWHEYDCPKKPGAVVVEADSFRKPLFPIKRQSPLAYITAVVSESAVKVIEYMRHFTECWNLYAIRTSIPDMEKAVKELPEIIDSLVKSLHQFKMDIQRRKIDNIQNDIIAITRKLNHVAHTIFFSFSYTENSAQKYAVAHQFSLAVFTLKRGGVFSDIWNNLAAKTKQICDAALFHTQPPSNLIDIDAPMFNFDAVWSSKLVLGTGSRLRYICELKNKENGAVIFTLGNDELIVWTGVKTLGDTENVISIEKNKFLLSEITKAQQVYSSSMENILPNVDVGSEPSVTPLNSHSKAIQHQRYRLMHYYFQLMFSSLGIPVRLPKYVGSSSEYWIVSADKTIQLADYLKRSDPFAQRQCARQLAEIYQKELQFGIKCLKSLQFEVHQDKIYACDLEYSYQVLPDVSSKIRRLRDVAIEIKKAYGQFTDFTTEFLKYVGLISLDCEPLSICKTTKTPVEFHKILLLSHVCTRYDLSFTEVFHSQITPQTSADRIREEVAKTFQLMPKKGQKVEALHTKTHFDESSNSLVIDATLLDTQFSQYAHLERLIVKDLIRSSLNSSSSLEQDFCETSLEVRFRQYLPAENESFYSLNDTEKNVGDYFTSLFWNDFVNSFGSTLNDILDNYFFNRTSQLAWLNSGGDGYKELLNSNLIEYNKERQAIEFFDRLSKI